MENRAHLFNSYSQRSSFMLYAEIALMQGLPIEEVHRKLEQMEKEIELMGRTQSEIELSNLGPVDSRLN